MRRSVVLLAVALLAAAAVASGQSSVEELAQRIKKERDAVDPAVFEELAALGGERSFRAFEKGVESLRSDAARAAAYPAFRGYRDDPELSAAAVEWLRREAARGKSEARRVAAVEALAGFGPEIVEVLESILARNDEPACRRAAVDALVPALAARGDLEGLLTIARLASFANAPRTYAGAPRPVPPETPHVEVVCAALGAADGPELRAALFERLAELDSPRAWRLRLVALIAERPGEDVSQALAAALADPEPVVAWRALHALQARDDWDDYDDALRDLFGSPDPALRRAAVLALGRLSIGSDAWSAEALELSRHADPAVRMGAAASLALLRTDAHVARLYELLADTDWSVRAETLQLAGALRRADAVPTLIERLRKERGRLRWDVYGALRALTGLDLGHLPDRWERWWAAEGATFELPTPEAAAQAERERVARGEAQRTVASSFYGLGVVSERVCFVIDISGSMGLPPGVFDPKADVPPGTRRRIDIAKQELVAALRALEDDALFNVIFFDTEVRPFSDRVQRMRRKSRGLALRFVDEQIALGATALYPALELAFQDPLVDTLYVLTDGAPTVGETTDIAEIRAEVGRWNAARHVQVHGVAMGIDSDLLRWLAEDTGGTYQRVD